MTTTPTGSPCWIELVTPDRDEAVAFYSGLFGWTATEPDEAFGGYSQWTAGDRPIGGLMPVVPGMTGDPCWSVYLATEDAEALAASAVAHGGSVVVGPMRLPDLGVSVVVADASGMAHCAWQADPFTGTETADVQGDPVWHEGYATDFATTHTFLREVFGWDSSMAGDTDEFRYALNAPEEDAATAGLMDGSGWGPEFTPSWAVYIKVDDMDACLARATELGGSVAQGPDDTPYGLLATLADPHGQEIKVLYPPAG